MRVIVRLGDLVPVECTLAEFISDNADGLTLAECEAVCTALAADRTYIGGGGAAEPFLIVRASRKADIIAAFASRGLAVEIDAVCEEIAIVRNDLELEFDELPSDLQPLATELARMSCSSEPLTGGAR